MKNYWTGKKILITGACGTVGGELIRQLLPKDPEEIVGIDNNESELFFIDQKYKSSKNVRFYLCDIKNKDQLGRLMEGVDIVLHAAARKHVIINEISPSEAIFTNIVGTQNVIEAALDAKVRKVIFTSSDKAVNPTNVMGTSKLMGERLMTAANAATRGQYPIFASTRFGNVLGSNGSVIPIFKRQIENAQSITLTDPEMSRFVMTIDEAASLVLESVELAMGGEVFVTKMPIIRIEDLAHAMIDIYKDRGINHDTQIKIIGAKAGEKMYEELINDEEIRRTVEIEDFFAVLPAFKSIYEEIEYDFNGAKQKPADRVYRSDLEKSMSVVELKAYLLEKELLSEKEAVLK